jgi:hypothetical protein
MAWYLSRIKWCDSENDQDEVESFPSFSGRSAMVVRFPLTMCPAGLFLMTAAFSSTKKPRCETAPGLERLKSSFSGS